VVISWGYHAAESFDDAILPFKKTGFEFMVAPGVNCWGQVWPDMGTAVTNIANYVRDGAKLGTMGVMNTVWNDDGENLFHYNWHGLLWGAECSWAPPVPLAGNEARRNRETRAASFDHAFDMFFFGTPCVMSALWEFDSLRALPARGFVTDGAMWRSVLEATAEDRTAEAQDANERAVTMSLALVQKCDVLKGRVQRNAEVLDAAAFAARRVAFTAQKNLARIALARARETLDSTAIAKARGMLSGLFRDLHGLKADYVTLWGRENRSWSLNRVLGKYDRLGNELLDFDKVVFIEPDSCLTGGLRSVRMRTIFADRPINYTVAGNEPTRASMQCDSTILIDRSALIRARVYVGKQGYRATEKFVMVHKAVGRLSRLESQYSLSNPAYAAGGRMGLLDGIRGSENFGDGCWQGYQGQDINLTIDLGQPTDVKRVSVGFLQNSYSWILMPERVVLWASEDGMSFDLVRSIPNTVDPREEGTIIHDVVFEPGVITARFLKVTAHSPGKLPAWHHAAGNDSYMFADEIVVE
jgi:hexosaminidase